MVIVLLNQEENTIVTNTEKRRHYSWRTVDYFHELFTFFHYKIGDFLVNVYFETSFTHL